MKHFALSLRIQQKRDSLTVAKVINNTGLKYWLAFPKVTCHLSTVTHLPEMEYH